MNGNFTISKCLLEESHFYLSIKIDSALVNQEPKQKKKHSFKELDMNLKT